jgi:hypothetical protein
MSEYTAEHIAALVEALTRELSDLPERIASARRVAQDAHDEANRRRGELAAQEAAHVKHLEELTAAYQAKCAQREHALAVRESLLVAEKREAMETLQRGTALIRTAEARAADLSNRLHGVGAR